MSIELSWPRGRQNLGCDTGHLDGFEMSCSFTVQVHRFSLPRSLIDGNRDEDSRPATSRFLALARRHLDEKVATWHLPSLGAGLTVFTQEHTDSIGAKVEDTFKGEHYRY